MRLPLQLCALLAALSVPCEAQETWPRFRGPDGRGLAAGGHAYPERLDLEQGLLWKCALPPGNSSPCITSDRIYVTGAQDTELTTLCIERETGKVLWRRSIEVEQLERTHHINGPASPTATADEERVMVYFGSFGLLAYDKLGEELWRKPLETRRNTFGTGASPVLCGERLMFLRDTNEGSYLEALDPATGERLWHVEREGFISGWSTPGVWLHDEQPELLVYGVWWLTGYDLESGKERWSVPGLSDEPIVTPVGVDGLVYVSSYNMNSSPEVIGLPTFEKLLEDYDTDGNGSLDRDEADKNESILSRQDADGEGDHPLRIFFRFLDEDRDGEISAEEWTKIVNWLEGFEHKNALVALRPGRGETPTQVVWQYSHGVPECPSPLHYRGRIYLVKNGGMATCLDAASGELKFQGRLDSRGPCYASPVAGDGKIYHASARGRLTVFAAADELKVLSQTDLDERIMATPALVDGVVHVRSEKTLYAFGTLK